MLPRLSHGIGLQLVLRNMGFGDTRRAGCLEGQHEMSHEDLLTDLLVLVPKGFESSQASLSGIVTERSLGEDAQDGSESLYELCFPDQAQAAFIAG